ncbi:uncharacterized protein LOC127751007 [Frankliniella occidentalis]|uniref:Uncharacterized protein LOC127751007 n=1 Tax=Frankliniella occidentalis TaxID=133901 RepID=A0A9C6XSU8_FRAOC|nr:uncharacterized protein LOC127751007 [Frankliniella occidentalis]
MGGDQIQLEDEALFVELTNLYYQLDGAPLVALPAPVPAPAPEATPAPEQPRAFWEDGTVQGDDFFIEEDEATLRVKALNSMKKKKAKTMKKEKKLKKQKL